MADNDIVNGEELVEGMARMLWRKFPGDGAKVTFEDCKDVVRKNLDPEKFMQRGDFEEMVRES